MITLGTVFGGGYLATRGGGTKATQTPPINASSKDEEDFVKYRPRMRLDRTLQIIH